MPVSFNEISLKLVAALMIMTENYVILNGGIFGKNSTILLKLSFDIFIDTGVTCIGFEAETSENIRKL